ncbi:hypothetical protein TRICHSKD4_2465 [Roseibium sp. TrichSKD4]|uniref:hypothetical protein n=1 Tax=Roseibium sp. TrichSKD4 TaxID=744980 RepID=UPI0001E56C22|nr:hypothetical protein [Roseibium sp. TrichSKD4]EFO32663.1 hypothetical protein TRICHSKD4_2465 [Roseibium sp. TrichSKD4]
MKLVLWALAAVLITLGLATVLLPIPTGVPLLALGAILIIATSRAAARLVRKQRKSEHRLNSAFLWLENRAPTKLARILKRTRPRSNHDQKTTVIRRHLKRRSNNQARS